jgi:hypothetical protein
MYINNGTPNISANRAKIKAENIPFERHSIRSRKGKNKIKSKNIAALIAIAAFFPHLLKINRFALGGPKVSAK